MDRVDEHPPQDDDPGSVADPEVGDPPADALEGEALVALRAQAAEAAALAEKLQRIEAGFVNETRRIRRQADEERKYAIETVVVELLPVVDALQQARAGLPGDDEASAPLRAGLDLVAKQLASVLERHGVSAIEALGRPFDPARHQAMMVMEVAGREPQTVAEVLRAGYELNGRVVRPAEVIVVKAPAPIEEGD